MSAPTVVDLDLVTRICRDATTVERVVEVVEDVQVLGDPLDGTAWVAMASWSLARDALTALNAYGISGHDHGDGRLHVTGWDIRLLHWRLGTLLAGVDDLTHEWDATAEMVCYQHDRRVDVGVDPDPAEVLADVETAIRRCLPFPRRASTTSTACASSSAPPKTPTNNSSPNTSTTPNTSSPNTPRCPPHDPAPPPPGTGPDQTNPTVSLRDG